MHDQTSSENAETQPNLFLRGDTILGVCEGIGQDFGFNPNWLRVLFAATFYWSPAGVIGAYLALGVLVAFSRLVAPSPRMASSAPTVEVAETSSDRRETELPLAA